MNVNQLISRIHVATILILMLALVGAISVLAGSLDWQSYFKDMTTGGGLLAIGRGLVTVGGK